MWGDMTSPDDSSATQKTGGSYKLLVGIGLTVGAAMVVVVFFSHRGLYNVYRFRQDKQLLEQENSRLAAENARLARTIDRLQHDPIFIQDLIRQELNFVKRNEIIIQFPPENPKVEADLPAAGHGVTAAPPRVQAISEKKAGKPKLASDTQEGSAKKRAAARRE